jgi:hypothetical protein
MLDSVEVTQRHIDDCDTILEIAVAGEFEPGSAGNETAGALYSRTSAIIRRELPNAVLFDFSKLEYEFGDAILSFWPVLLDDRIMMARPGVILPSTMSMAHFVSLLAHTHLPFFKIAITKEDGLQELRSWLAKQHAERRESREFRRRMLEALIGVFGERGDLPAWRSKSDDATLGSCWHTSLEERGASYYLAVGDEAALGIVNGQELLIEPGDDPDVQAVIIDGLAALIRSCLAGGDPERLFAAARRHLLPGPLS